MQKLQEKEWVMADAVLLFIIGGVVGIISFALNAFGPFQGNEYSTLQYTIQNIGFVVAAVLLCGGGIMAKIYKGFLLMHDSIDDIVDNKLLFIMLYQKKLFK